MDKQQLAQDQLCRALSADPGYILDQCGDMLTMNEFREIQKQNIPYDKMKVLLKIIVEKGKETYQGFMEIVAKHQSHYQQVPQLVGASCAHTATDDVTDGTSVVTDRRLTNVTGKKLNMRVETESVLGSRPAENAVGQTDGGIRCTDAISDSTFDDMDLSVSKKTSQAK